MKLGLVAFAVAAIAPFVLAGETLAQQVPPQFPNMTFFISSASGPKGADFGGIEGADRHCQTLAAKAGAGGKTWHAYLSVQARAARRRSTRATGSARAHGSSLGHADREDVDDLHSVNNKIDNETGLTENGQALPGVVSSSTNMTSSPDRRRTAALRRRTRT